MAKEEKTKDKLERDVTKLWYRASNGRTGLVYQYTAPDVDFKQEEPDLERMPIYVALEGQQGIPLVELLEDYERLKQQNIWLEKQRKDFPDEIFSLQNRVGRLEEVNDLSKRRRHWWKRR